MKSQIFRVVFEDSSLLVIEKLVPFLSQKADKGSGEGLYEFISRTMGISIFPVHRLDREVLGLMIFGKTVKAAEDLSRQFKDRSIRKTYLSNVKGRISKDEDTLIHYLAKNARTNHVTVYIRPTPGAKAAELHYRVIDRGEGWSRLLIDLKTGRSHQIRVQLAKIGHPIIGDQRYSKPSKRDPEGLFSGPQPIQLRSVSLEVSHPELGERMSWNLPYE